jgi:hypothetical protein
LGAEQTTGGTTTMRQHDDCASLSGSHRYPIAPVTARDHLHWAAYPTTLLPIRALVLAQVAFPFVTAPFTLCDTPAQRARP